MLKYSRTWSYWNRLLTFLTNLIILMKKVSLKSVIMLTRLLYANELQNQFSALHLVLLHLSWKPTIITQNISRNPTPILGLFVLIFSQYCPKFHIFTNIVIFQVFLQLLMHFSCWFQIWEQKLLQIKKFWRSLKM